MIKNINCKYGDIIKAYDAAGTLTGEIKVDGDFAVEINTIGVKHPNLETLIGETFTINRIIWGEWFRGYIVETTLYTKHINEDGLNEDTVVSSRSYDFKENRETEGSFANSIKQIAYLAGGVTALSKITSIPRVTLNVWIAGKAEPKQYGYDWIEELGAKYLTIAKHTFLKGA